MARSRNIKPSIMDNEALAALSPLTRLLFIYIWMLADRDGRLEDRPNRIHKQALGYDGGDVNEMLDALAKSGFIVRYEAENIQVIQIVNFEKHQSPHLREVPSVLPRQVQGTTKAVPSTNLGNVEAQPRSPDSLLLIPDSGFLNPDPLIPDSRSLIADPGIQKKPRSKPFAGGDTPVAPITAAVWESYSKAYQDRYGVAPVRNATVNGMLANFVRRIGAEDAPHVAAWYLTSNNAWYVQKSHPVSSLVQDAEGLRTEWATRETRTQTGARQADQTAATGNIFKALIDKYSEAQP